MSIHNYEREEACSYNLNIKELYLFYNFRSEEFNYTLLAPIHSWASWYYFTFWPPLIWNHSSSLIEIDIQSVCCFFLMMFLCAATMYLSTRCLRRRIPTTTGFGNILWDFVASFFFEPFPSDWGILSVRLVLGFWLLGITIFCNEINGVFKGKLSVKEYAGVETEEDLGRLGFILEEDRIYKKSYTNTKYEEVFGVLWIALESYIVDRPNIYISKKPTSEQIYVQIIWTQDNKSKLFEYDARVHETIKNWALRLYEGSDGNVLEPRETEARLRRGLDKNTNLFTPYEMADLSVPFRIFGYGMAAAIGVKILETILAIYRNNNNKRPKRKPQLPE